MAGLSFRSRLTAITAIVVTLALALGSLATYFLVRSSLYGELDAKLRETSASVASLGSFARIVEAPLLPFPAPEPGTGTPLPEPGSIVNVHGGELRQLNDVGFGLITPDGRVESSAAVNVEAGDLAIARRGGTSSPTTETIGGERVRVMTIGLPQLGALKLQQPLAETDATLGRLRGILLLVTLAGGAVAALGGRVLAKAQLAPVARLTALADRVTRTGDPTARIGGEREGELGRLASSFDAMLESLDRSLSSQRRLVADVSHELRTPLTSLRTNVEVLLRSDGLPSGDRERLRRDVLREIDELAALVGDITEAGRDAEVRDAQVALRLDEIVAAEVVAARLAHPEHRIALDAEPCVVDGAPDRLARAVRNLLENAVKFAPPQTTVEVAVAGGIVVVRDRGPGIDSRDLPHVFDRFYRAAGARALPGSGLGLAIVSDIARAHGGAATIRSAPGGGAIARLTIPPAPTALATGAATRAATDA